MNDPEITVIPTCQRCGAAESGWWECHRPDCGNHEDLIDEEWVRVRRVARDQKEKAA